MQESKTCLLCWKKVKNSPYSVCFDKEYRVNCWGGDSHEYIGYLCIKCGKELSGYITLETELIRCFRKRNIKVKTIQVLNGATKYVIEVER